MNPLDKIAQDRRDARGLDDANADICFLSLSENGRPSVRTLVLRSIDAQGLTLFINKTSAKWRIILDNPYAEAMVWYPSTQNQYRISGKIEELPREVIATNWHRRPAGSKYLDHAYEKLAPQSSVIESRSTLTDFVATLRQQHEEEDMQVPAMATGIILHADRVESLDLNSQDRLHDRRLYTLADGHWQESLLIP